MVQTIGTQYSLIVVYHLYNTDSYLKGICSKKFYFIIKKNICESFMVLKNELLKMYQNFKNKR